jgi:hypothetical protein
MRQARDVPVIAVRREFSLAGLAAVRAAMNPKVSWITLFARAYSLAAVRHSCLRRNWTSFPWSRIYEHPVSGAVVLVEREVDGEPTVLGGKIRAPEIVSLANIDRHVRRFQSAPVRTISCFRQLLRVGRYPGPLRRFVFWSALHWSGYRRCKRFGTFMISSLGNFGCETTVVPTPLTAYLTFGPIARDGKVAVGLNVDHRVMDGRDAARALEDVERILGTVILGELRRLAANTAQEVPALPSSSPSSFATV